MENHTQTNQKLNNTAVILPPEARQDNTATLPIAMPVSPMDYPVERFSQALERREDNRKALLKWIQPNLKAGVDFGKIHVVGKDKCRLAREGRAQECLDPRHWSKPSLWKPGAEKICGMLGLIPRFPNLSEYEAAVLRGIDIMVIILKCELHTGNGFIAAEGTGARRIAQDSGDINKSLKMAEKSAHIDATLRIAGLSELFTQDLEDMGKGDRERNSPAANQQTPHHQEQQQEKPLAGNNGRQSHTENHSENGSSDQSNGQTNGNRITGKQYKYIMDLMETAGMTKRELNAHCVKAYESVVDHITRADASNLIDLLQNR